MNFTCPKCGEENAYIDITDEKGTHYECPDCEHTWIDKDATAVIDEEDFEE